MSYREEIRERRSQLLTNLLSVSPGARVHVSAAMTQHSRGKSFQLLSLLIL